MFTGIIEEIGKVTQIQKGTHSAILQIQAKIVLEQLKIGDSVAVNGVCLTVTSISSHSFTADVMHETLNRSALSGLTCGSSVNLERAMPANGRFDGHIVAGHVDGIGKVMQIRRDDNAVRFTIQANSSIMHYIVEKGSIAIDGISLTVASLSADFFCVSVIPHTAKVTTLGMRKIGDTVNLENDIIGKYVEKFLMPTAPTSQKNTFTREWLLQHGY
ncbi:MAG: riboflavin synthase [Lachnospiraceae bacterium]|nr:riboflavin synthase [Lachnospiraceae bacterium]